MTRNDVLFYLAMAIFIVSGILMGSFAGGALVGAAGVLLPLVAIGRTQAGKAASRIDKRMRDIIVDRMEGED